MITYLTHPSDIRAALVARGTPVPAGLGTSPGVTQGTIRSWTPGDPASEDPAKRNATFEVVWSAGGVVARMRLNTETWQVERYDHAVDLAGFDLSRLNNGAPFLRNHDASSVDSVIGAFVDGSAKVVDENGTLIGVGTVRASNNPAAQGTLGDIRDGILRKVSMGFNPLEDIWTERDGQPALRTTTKAIVMEVSTVAIAADDGANTRSAYAPIETIQEKGTVMGDKQGITADETLSLIKRANTLGITFDDASEIVKRSATADVATAEFFTLAEKRTAAPIGGSGVEVGADRSEAEHAEGMILALMQRASPGDATIRAEVEANAKRGGKVSEYQNLTLPRLAEASLIRSGIPGISRMSTHDICREAMGLGTHRTAILEKRSSGGLLATGNFPNVLSNVVQRVLKAQYAAFPVTYTRWAMRRDLPNFRNTSFVQLSSAPSLEKVGENGEFARGTMTDSGNSFRVASFGKILGVTTQLIVNDDIGAFGDIPRMWANSARATETKTVYDTLIANDVMSDGNALFSAAHANLGNVTGKPTADGMFDDIAFVLGSQTTQPSPDEAAGLPMYLNPRLQIVPMLLAADAHRSLSTNQLFSATLANVVPAAMVGMYDVPCIEPYLDAVGATDYWYVAADPSRGVSNVTYGYLQGTEGPQITQREGFEVSGLEIKCELHFGAGATEHRGMVRITRD